MWFTNHGRSFPMRKAKTIRWRKIKEFSFYLEIFLNQPHADRSRSSATKPVAVSDWALLGCSSQPRSSNSPGRVPKPVKLSSNVTIALTRQSLTLTDKDCKFFRYYRNIDTKNMFIPDCGSAGQGGNGNSNLRASFLWPCKGICAAEPTVYWFFHISFFLSLTSLEITWSFQVRVIGLGRDKMEETHFRIFVC